MEAAGQYSALLQYPLHPSSLQQLQMLEPAGSWPGASAPMLRACAAALATLRLDAVQDAALAHAYEAAQPSIVQTSFLRHGNTAVSNPLRTVSVRSVNESLCTVHLMTCGMALHIARRLYAVACGRVEIMWMEASSSLHK